MVDPVRLASLVGAVLLSWTAAIAQVPEQKVHREGFEPVDGKIFAVIEQFYDYDAVDPLDVRAVDTWEDGGRRHSTLVFTTSSGERVPGDLVLPAAGREPYPAVLLLHGLGSDRDRWWKPDREVLPNALLAAGIAVMTIDLELHGQRAAANDYQSPVYLTLGNERHVRSRNMSIQSTIDARRALDLLVAHDEVDADRIAVAGYSMGAMIAVRLAALEPDLAAVVAGAIPTTGQPLPTDPFHFAPHAKAAVLLQVGRTDWLSSPQDARRLIGLFPGGDHRLKLYDAGHRLPPAFAAEAAEWLIGRLR